MSTKVNVYLSFDGTCEGAISFYEKVFGTKRAYSCTYGEQEEMASSIAEGDKNKILHSYLPISDDTALMAADVVKGFGPDIVVGNSVALSVSPDTEEEAKRIFAELSEGGQVIMPLEKAFWNALYGMFIDKFGVNWMVNYNYEDCI